jgi:serine/threonine protein kinase
VSNSIVNEIVGGKYDIRAEIEQGGSSIVYLATKLNSNERYAIKTLSTNEENAVKLLKRETDNLKRLNHRHIVRFIEEGYDRRHQIVYLVLEYLKGLDIQTYFDSGIDLKTKFNIFLQIISGISHAHSKNIIHRDIKPDNIKIVDIDEEPEAKILDFGIAVITTTILTNTIRSYYTPLFSAPEQITLEGVYRDSDIYSLGMTFLYLLSTREARINFQDEKDKNILFNSAEESLDSLSNYQELIEILIKATDKERENRPKLDQLRKVISHFREELAEKNTILFRITSKLQDQIDNEYDCQGQPVKIKRCTESNLKHNSGILHIKKSSRQQREDRLAVEICIETLSKVYYGFIDKNNPTAIVIYSEPSFVKPQIQETIIENGIAIKAEPIVEIGNSRREIDLSELVNKIIEKEQQVQDEIESNQALKRTFETWQSLIDIENNIIKDKKKIFRYQKKYYDSQKQLLILTLEQDISIEDYDEITSPPLPVTISVEKILHNNRKQEFQKAIGDIIDGD